MEVNHRGTETQPKAKQNLSYVSVPPWLTTSSGALKYQSARAFDLRGRARVASEIKEYSPARFIRRTRAHFGNQRRRQRDRAGAGRGHQLGRRALAGGGRGHRASARRGLRAGADAAPGDRPARERGRAAARGFGGLGTDGRRPPDAAQHEDPLRRRGVTASLESASKHRISHRGAEARRFKFRISN